MGYALAIAGLRRKRARLAGEIAQAEKALAKMRRAVNTLDATINLFEPATDPELIPPVRPYLRGLYFGYGELTRLCYDVLRQANGPVTTGQVADRAIAIKGLDVGRHVRERLVVQTRHNLVRMAARGKVRKIVDWPETWWESAG